MEETKKRSLMDRFLNTVEVGKCQVFLGNSFDCR